MSKRSAGDEAMEVLGRSSGFAQRFELDSKLGEGGMGAVYLVKDRTLDRPVAIKVILGGETIDRRRFEREARMLAQVTHPGVLRVFDFGVIEDIPYMAMELLDGESLREPLKRHGRLPPAETVSIMVQILSSLEAIHTKGIVHRDLKPENIQVLADGSIRLVDFGLARSSASPEGARSGSTLTQPGMVMGTPQYMSPEQCRGEAVGAPADLYAAGILLHELLTGAVPFFDANPMVTIHAHLTKDPPVINQKWPHLAAFAPVVQRALAKDPAARYSDAATFREALETIPLAGIRTARLSGVHVASTAAGQTATTTRVQPAAAPPAPGRRGLWLALIGVGVVLAGLAARPSTAPVEPPPPRVEPTPEHNQLEEQLIQHLKQIQQHPAPPCPTFVVSAHDRTGIFLRLPYASRIHVSIAPLPPTRKEDLLERSGRWDMHPHLQFLLEDSPKWEMAPGSGGSERLVHWLEIPWPEGSSSGRRVIRVTLQEEPIPPGTMYFLDLRGPPDTSLPRTATWGSALVAQLDAGRSINSLEQFFSRALLVQSHDQVLDIWSRLEGQTEWPGELAGFLVVQASAHSDLAAALARTAMRGGPRGQIAFTALLESSGAARQALVDTVLSGVPSNTGLRDLAKDLSPALAERVRPISNVFRKLLRGETFSFVRVETEKWSRLWVWTSSPPDEYRAQEIPREPDGRTDGSQRPSLLLDAAEKKLAGLTWTRAGPSDPPPRRVHLRAIPWPRDPAINFRVIKITGTPDPGSKPLAFFADERMTVGYQKLRMASIKKARRAYMGQPEPVSPFGEVFNPSVEYDQDVERCDPFLELAYIGKLVANRRQADFAFAIEKPMLRPDRQSKLHLLTMLKLGLEGGWLPEDGGSGMVEGLKTLDEPDLVYQAWEELAKHDWWRKPQWFECVEILAALDERIVADLRKKRGSDPDAARLLELATASGSISAESR